MWATALLVVGALIAAPSTAAGDPEHAAARAVFERGTLAWDAERYTEALHAYQRAYELSRAPELLFNVGQCRFELHDYDGAVAAYERYLREAGPSADRPLARERIAAAHAAADQRAGGGDGEGEAGSDLVDEWWFWGGVGVAAALVTTTVAVGTWIAQGTPAAAR